MTSSSPEELGCCLRSEAGHTDSPGRSGHCVFVLGATGAKPVLEGSREGGAVSGSQPCTSQAGDPSPALFAGTGSDFPQEQDPSRITGKGLLLEGLLPPLTVAVPLQDRCLRRRPGRTGRAAARGCPRPCA